MHQDELSKLNRERVVENERDLIVSTLRHDPVMKEVLGQFVGRLPQRVARMEESLAKGDRGELGRIVHQLKGACGGYGFSELSRTAARVEQGIRSNGADGSIEAIAREVAALVDQIKRVEGYGRVDTSGGGTSAAA